MNTDTRTRRRSATIRSVKLEEIRDVLRAYFREIIVQKVGDQRGLQKRFERLTGIKHAQTSNALSGEGEVSWGMLAKISETTDLRLDEMLSEIAGRAAALEQRKIRQAAERAAQPQRELVPPRKGSVRENFYKQPSASVPVEEGEQQKGAEAEAPPRRPRSHAPRSQKTED